MDKIYENLNKYGEEMEGKFSHKPSENGIVISVTSPFVEEIHIESDEDIRAEFYDTYSLLPPQAEHPKGESWCIYYNTEEQCYYRSEWQLVNLTPEGSKWDYVWVLTDKTYIVKHARKCEELQAHYRSYHDIHKGQLCVFTGYAIDPNGDFKKPSTVESMFDRHKWFFNPWSFKVSLLNEDTIDDFVEETPISKEMTQKMVLHHQEQDEIKLQKEKDDKEKNKKEKREAFVNKINAHFEKNEKLYKYGIGMGVLWLLGAILQIWRLLAN